MISIYDLFSFKIDLVLFAGNLILSVIIIFLERKSPQSTFAWVLFVWVFPIIGFLFYLFLSQNLTRRKIYKFTDPEIIEYDHLMEGKALVAPAALPAAKGKTPAAVPQSSPFDTDYLRRYQSNIEYHFNTCGSMYTDNNHLTIYTDGCEKFQALFEAIRDARDTIHIEYYIIKFDDMGKYFMNLLIQKAREGVEVLLLFDEEGGRYVHKSVLRELQAAGGQYGVFFPSKTRIINVRVNYRDHRKIAVIDGKKAFIGGFNVGNEYLGLKRRLGYWRDTHLQITGYAAYEIQKQFLLDWSTTGRPDPITEDPGRIPRYFPAMDMPKGSGVQIVCSGPDDYNPGIKNGFLRMITNARRNVFIQTPYFVPDDSILEALKIAALSGVDVRIMIPDKPDHIFIYWASLSCVGELIKAGAKIYFYHNGFIHAKTITVDDEICSVGSCNFDIRSFSLNFESNAFIYDPDIAKKLADIYRKDQALSIHYDMEMYLHRKKRVQVKESISRLFAPLL